MAEPRVVPAAPRSDVQARLPDGRCLNAPVGTPLEAFAHAIATPDSPLITAMLVNGVLRELIHPLQHDSDITPLDMHDYDGMLIYRRTLVMLLAAAASECLPETQLTIEHSLFAGGYFGRPLNRPPFSTAELAQLEAHMRTLVEADAPIVRREVPLAEAIAVFGAQGDRDKVRLLHHRTAKNTMIVYTLRGYTDYHYGYKLPSTGYLRWFGLQPLDDGFVLRFPRQAHPTRLDPVEADNNLLAVFEQYNEWLRSLGIASVGALNDAVEAGRGAEISLVQEALQESQLADLVRQITSSERHVQLVLIAGPSASGKTTFSKRLAVQLLARGVRPVILNMDDWFVNRVDTPRNASGEYDFEALEAVDVPRLNRDLQALIQGATVILPHYNFLTGEREPGDTVQATPDTVFILEGIHGLNPALTPTIPLDRVFRIYISALTALNLDSFNRVSTTDTRIIRRLVRDAQFRGYSAAQTLGRWEQVRAGERRYIFPYQQHADAIFNSALVHELSVLRPLAEPLLLQVQPEQPEQLQAKRLISLLQWFKPLRLDDVPETSLLREFTGGSALRDFRSWRS